MDEVVAEFLVESTEALDRIDLDFIALENDASNKETLASVFRAIHTIKGTCGFLGFSKLESLTHVGENLLGRLRDGEMEATPEIITALLSLSDAIREMLGSVEHNGTDGDKDYAQLVALLQILHEQGTASAGGSQAPAPKAEAAPQASHASEPTDMESAPAPAAAPAAPAASTAPAPAAAVDAHAEHDSGAAAADTRGASVADRTVRVDVGLLDSLMNQVGELVLARNQILQYSATCQDPVFLTTTQRLNLITSELQEDVMKTRMQAIGTIWSKLPRVVRDLARTCGKKVHIEMEGEETELDRTIIEAIKDPLTHVIRNSVDHGIELPQDRIAAGKPEEGRIWLRAYHEGGHVNIEIHDDGGGIDRERVKEKAIRNNRITADQAARMSEREALNLIFLPGLSTAKQVTNISGRGVGMDVVKTNIEKIGGAVDIQSTQGKGSVLRIKIPLTLAIIPALIVTSGGDSYAIPQVSLLELVRLDGDKAAAAVEMIHNVPVYRLRGDLLPIVWLNEQLGVAERNLPRRGEESVLNIAVLQADDRQFGLVVDEINDNQEIVVKPLDKLLSGLTSYAGATIMGDGTVALILDAFGIAQRAGVISRSRNVVPQKRNRDGSTEKNTDNQTLLLFSAQPSDRMAVPLSQVARLEEFPRSAIERAGGREVIQYRDEIMPLVNVAETLGLHGGRGDSDDPVQVIVYSAGGPAVGLVVDAIVDIVEQRVVVERTVSRRGVVGSAVVQGKVTEIVDAGAIVAMSGLEQIACAR